MEPAVFFEWFAKALQSDPSIGRSSSGRFVVIVGDERWFVSAQDAAVVKLKTGEEVAESPDFCELTLDPWFLQDLVQERVEIMIRRMPRHCTRGNKKIAMLFPNLLPWGSP